MSKNISNMLFRTFWTPCKKPHFSTWSRSWYTFFWITPYMWWMRIRLLSFFSKLFWFACYLSTCLKQHVWDNISIALHINCATYSMTQMSLDFRLTKGKVVAEIAENSSLVPKYVSKVRLKTANVFICPTTWLQSEGNVNHFTTSGSFFNKVLRCTVRIIGVLSLVAVKTNCYRQFSWMITGRERPWHRN